MTARRFAAIISFIVLLAVPAFSASNVLVVINDRSVDSREVGSYYAAKRHIPANRICRIRTATGGWMPAEQFENEIRDPIRAYLDKNNLEGKIDYIVLTKGVPIAAHEGKDSYSVDSALTCLYSRFIHNAINNPYFQSKARFSYNKFGFVMVTRLDGYTKEDAKRLVDLSLRAKPEKGLFVFDIDPKRDGAPGYQEMNQMMRTGSADLEKRGFRVHLDQSAQMCSPQKGVMGFYTWGSNDHGWDFASYSGNSFLPGAIAETLVSTSARTFDHTKGGQSLITDLIARGITGIKGYCSEPYTPALAHGDILFDRYTKGFNLAESFYASSRALHWKDIVIGDPLCAPYAKR